MNKTSLGWIVFIGCIGMMASLMAVDIGTLKDWHEVTRPAFIGGQLGHLGTVIAAFVAGKIMPEDRDPNSQTRVSDRKIQELNQEQKP